MRNRWSVLALVVVMLLAAAVPALADEGPQAQVLGRENAQALWGQYIVVFKADSGPAAVDEALAGLANMPGAAIRHRYNEALLGFAGALPDVAVQALQRNPHVDFIEVDGVVSIDATQSPATWGIDRIDQRSLPLSNSFTYTATGAGVTAYIVDTGITYGHNEFGGRASFGYDAFGGNGADCNGHGTHVAGTVGGSTYGVAKGVNLVAVRVLDCGGSGSTSGVIAGVDWVATYAKKPAVANMSLGGSASSSLDNAVTNAINMGVTFGVAAGNSNRDACRYSPARTAAAITVGATTNTDARASYSNYGTCLDLFAPGSSITSAWYTSNTATNTISGTSMATPHVVGVAALYLQGNPSATPATVRTALVNNATTGKVTNAGRGSPNVLLYTNY